MMKFFAAKNFEPFRKDRLPKLFGGKIRIVGWN